MVLNECEQRDLRAAVLEYLTACKASTAVLSEISALPPPTSECALEKRWGVMRRLSAKNLELEAQVRSLSRELQNFSDLQPGDLAAHTSSNIKTKLRPLVPNEISLATLKGHRDTLTAVSLHPTELLCFSSSEDGTVRVWELDSFSLVQTLRPHSDTVNQVAVEPNLGATFATCSNDRAVKIFARSASGDSDVGNYECTRTLLGHDEPVSCICWLHHDNSSLLSASRGGDIRLWDINKCVPTKIFFTNTWVRCLTVPVTCTNVFASCGNDESVAVWDVAASQPLLRHHHHSNIVHAVAFSHYEADCTLVASHGSEEHRSWLAAEKDKRDSKNSQNSQYQPLFIASGGRDKFVKVSDIRGVLVCSFDSHQNWVRAVHFTKSGKFLASASDDGCVIIFDLINRRMHRKLLAHNHFVTCMHFASGRETMVVTGSADATIKVWRCS